MKKSILLLSVIIAVIGNSCTFSFSSNQKDLQKQINQLQQEVATLQKMNGLTPSYEISDDTVTSSKLQKTADIHPPKTGISVHFF